jgi:hypothetical protein
MVAETESGRAELRLSSLEPYLEDRLRTLDWVRDPDVHARVRKGSAKIDARALSRRMTASDDLAEARDVLAASIAETGLEAGRVRVRPTTDKKTLRVR